MWNKLAARQHSTHTKRLVSTLELWAPTFWILRTPFAVSGAAAHLLLSHRNHPHAVGQPGAHRVGARGVRARRSDWQLGRSKDARRNGCIEGVVRKFFKALIESVQRSEGAGKERFRQNSSIR